mmetsp:Transcript_19147/g.48654  ORF Transcript_19147/g.48654 Transcript_19147/m.48654 type:complete len:93 (-) Transcript_19147:5284-5562(-)
MGWLAALGLWLLVVEQWQQQHTAVGARLCQLGAAAARGWDGGALRHLLTTKQRTCHRLLAIKQPSGGQQAAAVGWDWLGAASYLHPSQLLGC